MYLKHLRALGLGQFAATGGLCLAPEGAPAAGGPSSTPAAAPNATPPAADAAPPADRTPAGDPGAAERSGARDDADDADDEDDFGPSAEVLDALPDNVTRNQLRAAQRKLAKWRPYYDTLRDPQTGKRMSTQQLQEMAARSRDYELVDRVLRGSPKALQILQEEDARLHGRDGQPAAAAEDQPQAFDQAGFEADWPYELDSDAGKRFYAKSLAAAKQTHEAQQTIQKLTQRLDAIDQRDQSRTVEGLNQNWKTKTLAASQEVDEAYRGMFVRAVQREFKLLRASGRLTKANVDAVITDELKEVRAAKKAAGRSTATRQSEMVAGNAALPRTPRPGSTQPAGQQPQAPAQNMEEARKRLFARAAAGQ